MKLPEDHTTRMARARLSLEGLSVGDAFGQRFFVHPAVLPERIEGRQLPHPPWPYTDDTAMALSIYDELSAHGRIDQDSLARRFAESYRREPDRGYGGGAHRILQAMNEGEPWRSAAGSVFGGEGSHGNGGAMRTGPVGAYHAGDLPRALEDARASAQVTHAHPDGQAGAMAIAAAVAFAWRERVADPREAGARLVQFVLDHTPEGPTRRGLEAARETPLDASISLAADRLGAGEKVLSSDTVPFSVWCAARCLGDFEEAMWTTVAGLGDRDTTCAIVGSIVIMSAGEASLPEAFRQAREPLPV